MKTLYLIRHAKSSWENTDLDDFDRPLNNRGARDAVTMGNRLRDQKITSQVILTSPALRALTTARTIAGILNCSDHNFHLKKELYHADENRILKILQQLPDTVEIVMVFGHNPGLTLFANDLLNDDIGNIPTTGVVAGQLNIGSWKSAGWNSGKLIFFDYPKKSGS